MRGIKGLRHLLVQVNSVLKPHITGKLILGGLYEYSKNQNKEPFWN